MIFKNKRKPTSISTSEGECIYAIGDIHGRYDLLIQLMSKIVKRVYTNDRKGNFTRLIFLGDIIDRGPESLKCLKFIQYLNQYDAEVILGNHEDLLLRSIDGDDYAQKLWFQYGGLETLKSIGLKERLVSEDSFDFGERLKEALPENVLTMLKKAPISLRSGDYLFVHAGVRPGVPLIKQTDFDLMCIRQDFTSSKDWHGSMIVHGHSIVKNVEIHDNRIAVDTGAYKTGLLSCMVLEGVKRDIITVKDSGFADAATAESIINIDSFFRSKYENRS